MPLDLAMLRQRIEHAVAGIDHQMVRAWQELDYRIDVCRLTNGGHMEHLKACTDILRDTLSSGTNLSSMSPRNPGGTFDLPCTWSEK